MRPLTDNDGIDYRESGNAFLDSLFGATVQSLPDAASVGPFLEERASALENEGHRGYSLPPGASSPRASLGYAHCALEITDQEQAMGLKFDRVVVPNGSAGTQAGLVAGFTLLRRRAIVLGFSVLADTALSHANTLAMARECSALLEGEHDVRADDVVIDDSHRGSGYGHLTRDAADALNFLARREGLLLDPVYSAKAFAGLLDLAKRREFARGENILFIMTGGTPALFAYRKQLSGSSTNAGMP